ncbi:MAG: S9 family peptidase, partial [Bacteroidetes bacterium]|nr:S9 family peptidase [Bacteroidota bacterium]
MARYATVLTLLVFVLLPSSVAAQEAGQATTANYALAARFAPYKIQQLIYSTSVSPRWIEGSERFWYEWETSDGTFFYLVDPVQGAKRQLFDNDRIAAELTRITLDPWDGKHLPIRSIRFIDENTLQFEVESSQDEEQEEDEELEEQEEDEEDGEDDTDKKVFHFEYDVTTRTLRELADFEAPDNHPSWASVSPGGHTVIFARHHELYG